MAARRGLGERGCLLEETLRRPTTVQGGIRRATPESGAVVGEAGACRRDGLLRARGPPPTPLGPLLALRLAEIRGSRDLGEKKKNVPVRNKLKWISFPGFEGERVRVVTYGVSFHVHPLLGPRQSLSPLLGGASPAKSSPDQICFEFYILARHFLESFVPQIQYAPKSVCQNKSTSFDLLISFKHAISSW